MNLYKQLYPPGSYFPNDYFQNITPYDLSAAFRNTNIVPTSSNGLPTSSNASSMIRNQLNMAALPPMFNYAGSTSGTIKAPNSTAQVRKRRQSNAKKPTVQSSNMESLLSLQHRYNGSLVRPVDDILSTKNSSAHLSILPDGGDSTVLRSSPSQNKQNSSNGNRTNAHVKDNRAQKVPFNPSISSNQPRVTTPSPNTSKSQTTSTSAGMVQRIKNVITSAFSSTTTPTTKSSTVVARRPLVLNPATTPRAIAGSPSAMSRSLQPISLAPSGSTVSSAVYRATPTTNLSKTTSSKNFLLQSGSTTNLLQRTGPSKNLSQRVGSSSGPVQGTSSSSNLSQRAGSSTSLTPQASSLMNLSQRVGSSTNLSQRSSSTANLSQRSSLATAQREHLTSSSARTISVKDVSSINAATTIKPIQRTTLGNNLGSRVMTPQFRSSGVPKFSSSQNMIPQKEAVSRAKATPPAETGVLAPLNAKKIVMSSAHLTGKLPNGSLIPATVKQNPISITKLNQPGSSARQEVRTIITPVVPSGITVHKLPPQLAKINSQKPASSQINRIVVPQKRRIEVRLSI